MSSVQYLKSITQLKCNVCVIDEQKSIWISFPNMINFDF